jgi:hypothetical protein
MTGAIILSCAVLLHPHQGEGFNTTVIRVNKRTPDACVKASAELNNKAKRAVCTCVPPRVTPKHQSLVPATKD